MRKKSCWESIWYGFIMVWLVVIVGMIICFLSPKVTYADQPKIIMNGQYVSAESGIEIFEAPPINNISSELDEIDRMIENNPYLALSISDDEFQELRWVLALEAQGEGFVGEVACCEAIFNRMLSANDWGQRNGLHGVLSMRGQFSTYKVIGSKKAWAVPGQLEDDAISECLRSGPTYLPSLRYVYFDSRGGVNGKGTIKLGNHYFGRE